MADRLDKIGLSYFYNRLKTVFATKAELNVVDDKADELIAIGAQPNVIEKVKVNGTALTPDGQKAVDVTVPVIDSTLTDTTINAVQGAVIKAYIDYAISQVAGLRFQKVEELPATGEAGTIYLVFNEGASTAGNVYDEYIWLDSWEKIGTTDIDLTNYFNTSNLPSITTSEIDQIMA